MKRSTTEVLTFTSDLLTPTIPVPEKRVSRILFGPKAMAFTSPEDLMKNLPKAMGNVTGMMGGGGLGDTLIQVKYESMKTWA